MGTINSFEGSCVPIFILAAVFFTIIKLPLGGSKKLQYNTLYTSDKVHLA